MAVKTCPCCEKPTLKETSISKQKVDLCTVCTGFWCEPTDWEANQVGTYPDHQSKRREEGHERAPDIVVTGKSKFHCPACERPLTSLTVGVPSLCAIDQCDFCGGIWFDREEWENLKALRQWPIELAQIEAATNAKNWWLQFLLRIPIEFNLAPRRRPVVTIGLISLCVLVYALQVAYGRDAWLPFATRPSDLAARHGYGSLLTSIFLHGNLFHLLSNMYFLYVLGDNVEDALGWRNYLFFYLACGVIANLVDVTMRWGSTIPALGASGAIAGVIAAYLLLFRRARLTTMVILWQVKVVAWLWLGTWIVLNLLNGLITLSEPNGQGGVAWWAHIGGFLAGLLLIWPLEQRIVRKYPLLHVMRTQGAEVRWVQWR